MNDREPFDPRDYGNKEDELFHLLGEAGQESNVYYAREEDKALHFAYASDRQMYYARYALGVFALIRGFDPGDLALMTSLAAGSATYALAFEDKLAEETGIIFTLTMSQWATIHSEVAGT